MEAVRRIAEGKLVHPSGASDKTMAAFRDHGGEYRQDLSGRNQTQRGLKVLDRMSALAAGLGVSLPWCPRLVDRLVIEGMIERREEPLDRRLVFCELSGKGRELVNRLWKSGQMQTIQALLEEMTAQELRVVAQAMSFSQRALVAVESPEAASQRRSGATS